MEKRSVGRKEREVKMKGRWRRANLGGIRMDAKASASWQDKKEQRKQRQTKIDGWAGRGGARGQARAAGGAMHGVLLFHGSRPVTRRGQSDAPPVRVASVRAERIESTACDKG